MARPPLAGALCYDDTAYDALLGLLPAGCRWVVPVVLLGLVVGAVAARRSRDEEPRQVLISSEA